MAKSKIFVCGATGTKGGTVARALLRDGSWEVYAGTTDPSSANRAK